MYAHVTHWPQLCFVQKQSMLLCNLAMPCRNVSIFVVRMQRCAVLLGLQLYFKEDVARQDIDHSLIQICSYNCKIPYLPAVVQMTHLHVSRTSCMIPYTSACACSYLPWQAQALLLSRSASCQHSSAYVSGCSSSTQQQVGPQQI